MLVAGKYELLRQIGRGGMGAVYEARNVSTLKRCAVKVLLTPELADDEEVVRRFFREARASGLIESDHGVAAYDSGIDDAGRAYYVMDALQGEDLQQALRRLGPLPPIAAAKIIFQAASGLASAHALGIVHRDVKPANLFLAVGAEDEIKVKILDFGVAKVKMEVFHESSQSLTRTGSMLGTPLYMSPEQVKRASSIDESADVWSLGVVLFECTSGKLPWGGVESFGELIAAVLTLDLPLLQDYAAWVPRELAGIVHRTLSRHPQSRMRTAEELGDALRRFLGGDVRLYKNELKPVSDSERDRLAERLSLADTMVMPANRLSAGPLSSRSRGLAPDRRWVAIAAACAVLGGGAWVVSRGTSAAPPVVIRAPAAPPPALTPTLVGSIDIPVPGSSKRVFSLEVGPPGVQVIVDGIPSMVQDGKVQVGGGVGSEHLVTLTWKKQVSVQHVVISDRGIVPRRLTSPATDARKPDPAPTAPKPVADTQANEPESELDQDGGLSPVFR